MSCIPDMTEARNGYYTYVHVGWLGSAVPSTGQVPKECCDILRHLIEYHATNKWLGSHACEMCGVSTRWSEDASIGGNGDIYFPMTGDAGCSVFVAPTMILHYILAHSYYPPVEFRKGLVSWWNSSHADRCREGKCRQGSTDLFPYGCLLDEVTEDYVCVLVGPDFIEDDESSVPTRDALEYIFKKKLRVVKGHEFKVAAEIERWAFCPDNPKHQAD